MPTNIASMTVEEFEGLIRKVLTNVLAEKKASSKSEFLTVKEAASYLRMPASTLYNKASQKEIPHYKPGKSLLFRTEDLDNWVKSKQQSKRNVDDVADNLLLSAKKNLKVSLYES